MNYYFSDLNIGEHFILLPLEGRESRVYRKVYPVESKQTPGLYYTAQDHVTGVILPICDDEGVICVELCENLTRPVGKPANETLASGVTQKGQMFYELYEKRFGSKYPY